MEAEKKILADSVKILLYFPPFAVFTNVSKKKKKKKDGKKTNEKKKNDQVSTDINHPKSSLKSFSPADELMRELTDSLTGKLLIMPNCTSLYDVNVYIVI